MLTKGALYCWALKSVSRETNRVKQGQGPRSLRPGPFFGPRGGWVLTYGPGRADRWPRTRQRGHLATDRGPGSAALVFVNLATGSQTRTGPDHKHKHGPGSSCATRQPPAAAARPGSHRHQVQAARPRQRPAANNCSSSINLAANNCTRCSNLAANNCKLGSAAHGPGSHRQQLRSTNQAAAAHRYTLHVLGVQARAPRGRPGRWPRGPG